ncbi:hypothetical protein GQX74_003229 [Glossina fuscipes]|nr:hypothetical protein GQX74_003229 [Glossina fuscipes]
MLTLLMVVNISSSLTLNNAFLCTDSTSSGCKLRIAATAILEIAGSYSKENHLACNSDKVNLHENFVPRCTMRKSFVCKIPMIKAKSSMGFQRPKSLVDLSVIAGAWGELIAELPTFPVERPGFVVTFSKLEGASSDPVIDELVVLATGCRTGMGGGGCMGCTYV